MTQWKIQLEPGVAAAIRMHAAAAYPEECCGILLGRESPGGRVIVRALAAGNISQEPRGKHFVMDPRDQLAAEKTAAAEQLDVLGFYHSHPDHPARPSETDHAAAWEVYSYVIVSVSRGEANEMRSYRLAAGVLVAEALGIGA